MGKEGGGRSQRNRERGREKHAQGNISLRSADAICSPVVKGRSVGSVCANSCELTAYIGLPFCSALASLRSLPSPCVCLSLFVRIHVHAFLLRTTADSCIRPHGIGCSARDLSPRARAHTKKREKKQKKKRKNCRIRVRRRERVTFVHRRNLITFGGFNFEPLDGR